MSKWDKFTVERVDITEGGEPVAVFRLSGTWTDTHESYSFLESLQAETRRRPIRCVLNLEGLEHMTSAGLGILAACFTSVTNSKGRMALAGITGRVNVILNVMRMLEIIPNAQTENDAIRLARS
jgi:anti-anti-sigma factor